MLLQFPQVRLVLLLLFTVLLFLFKSVVIVPKKFDSTLVLSLKHDLVLLSEKINLVLCTKFPHLVLYPSLDYYGSYEFCKCSNVCCILREVFHHNCTRMDIKEIFVYKAIFKLYCTKVARNFLAFQSKP